MAEFNKTSPVISLMAKSPIASSGQQLLKYALLDLLYRGALELSEEWRLIHPRLKRPRRYIMISRGPNYKQFRAQAFHLPLLIPFQKEERHMQLRSLLSYSFKNLKSCSNYKQKIVGEYMKAEGYLLSFPLLSSLNVYVLSKSGRTLRASAERELGALREALRHKSKPKHLIKILKACGPNCLLVNLNSPHIVGQIRQALKQAQFSEELKYVESVLNYHTSLQSCFDSFDFTFTGYETVIKYTSSKDLEDYAK